MKLLVLILSLALICVQIGADEIGAAVQPKDSATPVWVTGNSTDREQIWSSVFSAFNYNKRIFPEDIHLAFGGYLINFHLDEEAFSTFEANVWLRYKWRDSRLSWNPEEHGGVNVMHVPSEEIWKPDITLYNSAEPSEMMSCTPTQAIVYSTGDVLWIPPCRLSAHCPLSLDVAPYGEQTCTLKFGSWTLDNKLLDIDFFDGKHEFGTTELSRDLSWEVVSQSAKKNTKEYPCCPGMQWPDLEFNFTVKRVPEGPARHSGHAH